MKFEGECVEVDGVHYIVSGMHDLNNGNIMALDIRAPNNNLADHLMDSVVEDIITEIVLRFSGVEG